MSTKSYFTTLPPELRLMIYELVLSPKVQHANEFFQQPAYSVILVGKSPFDIYKGYANFNSTNTYLCDSEEEEELHWNAPDELRRAQHERVMKKLNNRLTLLYVCKLVRREVQAQIVYTFREFSTADMRAWAACVGQARVAAMQRWTFETVIDCKASYDARPDESSVSESESDGEERAAQDCLRGMTGFFSEYPGSPSDDGECDHGPRFHRDFHFVRLDIDMSRIRPSLVGKPYGTSDKDEDLIHSWDWIEHFKPGCRTCWRASGWGAFDLVADRLLQGRGQPAEMSGELLCSLLDDLSQGARNTKRRRIDWALYKETIPDRFPATWSGGFTSRSSSF